MVSNFDENVLTARFSKMWKMKRRKSGCCGFGVKDFINLQCNGRGNALDRDLEMMKLRCQFQYQPENNINEPSIPIFVCKFCIKPSFSNVVASADENGFVSLHDINNFEHKLSHTQTHENAVFELTWVPNDTKFLTLSGDHTAKLWDCGEAEVRKISTFRGHCKSVKTADFRPTDPATFVTGSRDGSVMLWDSRSRSKISDRCDNIYSPDQVILRAAADQSKTNKKQAVTSVTAVVFQDDNNLLCSGSSDADIRVWDMRKTYCVNRINEPKYKLRARRSGFSDLKLNPERTKLYASCMNSSIYAFNLNSHDPNPIAEFEGHEPGSFYIKTCVSNDGQYLLSGSSDKMVYVWRTRGAELLGTACRPFLALESHVAEVTGVDINQNGFTSMVTCADDGTLRLWRPNFIDTVNDHDSPGLRGNYSFVYTGEDIPTNRKEETAMNMAETDVNQGSTDLNDYVGTGLEDRMANTSLRTPISKSSRINDNEGSSKRKIRETSPCPEPSSASKRPVLSPAKLIDSEQNIVSPTVNLPNYIVDGTGPYHRCSRSRQKENIDWLTQIRRTSATRSQERVRNISTSSEKRSSDSRSGKFMSRASTSGKGKTSRKTLLEYYKKSSKGNDDSTQKLG